MLEDLKSIGVPSSGFDALVGV